MGLMAIRALLIALRCSRVLGAELRVLVQPIAGRIGRLPERRGIVDSAVAFPVVRIFEARIRSY